MEPEWELIFPFDDQSEEFLRGVEIGRIYNQMQKNQNEIKEIIHDENIDVLEQMAEHFEYYYKFIPSVPASGWMEFEALKQ